MTRLFSVLPSCDVLFNYSDSAGNHPNHQDKTNFWSSHPNYFIDNGILNLFLLDDIPSLLENTVAIHLCSHYGKDSVSYYNAGKEIDFVVSEEKTAIQVSYSIKEPETYDRQIAPLAKFAQTHEGWKLFVITYEEEDTIPVGDAVINVVPAYKWMLQ